MDTGQIQLGVKRSSGKSLDRHPTQGFFCAGAAHVDDAYYYGCKPNEAVITNRPTNKLLIGTVCVSKETLNETVKARRVLLPQHLIFYDNPSQKRVARCTNIPHTGALPTVKGVEQRLRKGFQGQKRRGSLMSITRNTALVGCKHPVSSRKPIAYLESLSSAAANKAPSEKYEVMRKVLCLCLNS